MVDQTTLPLWALKASGNPYARIDEQEEERAQAQRSRPPAGPVPQQLALAPPPNEPPHVEPITRAARQKPGTGNPYARLNDGDGDGAPGDDGISMADVDAACRAVFRPYVPVWARTGALPPHFRDFIARNRRRNPRFRRSIVAQLEKYSLSDTPQLATQFNRESPELTAKKLLTLEKLAGDNED